VKGKASKGVNLRRMHVKDASERVHLKGRTYVNKRMDGCHCKKAHMCVSKRVGVYM